LHSAAAGGRYRPWRSGAVQRSLGYELYQSLHFALSDFNLQEHLPGALLTIDAADACWTSSFTSAGVTRNDTELFKAFAPDPRGP